MSLKDFFLGGLFAIFLLSLVTFSGALVQQVNDSRVIANTVDTISALPTLIATNLPRPSLPSFSALLASRAPSKTEVYQQPQVLSAQTQAARFEPPPAPSTSLGTIAPKPVNILLLGLDSRKEDQSARCDAIHLFQFLPDEQKIIINSVPRGTMTTNGNIIANNCSLFGFPTAIKEIEKITGVHPDYVVKVGFSEAMGAMRLVNLPASPTLQFLRDRHDYLIGDNQRSYNQAVFLKDAILRYSEWGAKLPGPVQYLAYRTVDTDMPYEEAQELFREFLSSKIYENPDNIQIVIKPKDNFKREEIHVEDKVATGSSWLADPEFKAYQNDVIGYINAIIKVTNRRAIDLAINKKLWLQVEDPTLRNQLHLNLLRFASDQSLIQDFILEMDQAGETDLKNQAEALLK